MAFCARHGTCFAMKIAIPFLDTLLITVAALSLPGCAGSARPPDWQANAHSELNSFAITYLSGNTRLAERDFVRARSNIAGTGRGDLLARAELFRCAVRVASLEFDDCAGYQPLAPDADAAAHSYAAYLTGQWAQAQSALLPPQHRAVLSAPAGADHATLLGAIADPMARLVAAGALLRSGRLAPADIAVATETASAQGWRRPLLAWLGVQLRRARQAGAAAEVARIEHRITLITPLAP